MSGVEVIVEDLDSHPRCPHGPTLLFSRTVNQTKRNFFACSACRDRKLCPFYLEQQNAKKHKTQVWEEERKKLVKGIDHRKSFITLNKIRQVLPIDRGYCHTCSSFQQKQFWNKHKDHDFVTNITDYHIQNPSVFLPALEDPKKEAQFLFAPNSIKVIVDLFKQLNYRKIISVGTPRIHDFVTNECPDIDSLLLDFDSRYHNFYGPLQFCWYNSFNHYFFLPESREIFHDFLKSDRLVTRYSLQLFDCCCSSDHVLVLDPPFGGRVEPLAHTINIINQKYQELNKTKNDLPVFWIFPYFMEPQILNSLPNFAMLDYKVDYDNHPLFQDGAKARKYGSPVRIFTNVDPKKIMLPSVGYKFCEKCEKWVSQENKHCSICQNCTSKDGRTYLHCRKCQRCVKPSWQHCEKCDRCCQPDHKCGKFEFRQECFHCKQPGHKKRECPNVDHEALQKKRRK